MYVTYGIFHPVTGLCYYVGQTGNFEERERAHLTAHRRRKPTRDAGLAEWLKKLNAAGIDPKIKKLDVVLSEAASLGSEQRWVDLFADLGHPLLNGWSEHRDAINEHSPASALPGQYEAVVFRSKDGRKARVPIGSARQTKNGTGYRVKLDGFVWRREFYLFPTES